MSLASRAAIIALFARTDAGTVNPSGYSFRRSGSGGLEASCLAADSPYMD